eukprot:TRINITY_DN809_c0_g1_i1.p1 TRINITY_DN809_c0_g1~~TRINITY_DN809_c0_g1_i1.p1  ORF type:complete len:355 (-),score=18.92 TRINITY_DN809_c0_g1_i1:74-1075(-)
MSLVATSGKRGHFGDHLATRRSAVVVPSRSGLRSRSAIFIVCFYALITQGLWVQAFDERGGDGLRRNAFTRLRGAAVQRVVDTPATIKPWQDSRAKNTEQKLETYPGIATEPELSGNVAWSSAASGSTPFKHGVMHIEPVLSKAVVWTDGHKRQPNIAPCPPGVTTNDAKISDIDNADVQWLKHLYEMGLRALHPNNHTVDWLKKVYDMGVRALHPHNHTVYPGRSEHPHNHTVDPGSWPPGHPHNHTVDPSSWRPEDWIPGWVEFGNVSDTMWMKKPLYVDARDLTLNKSYKGDDKAVRPPLYNHAYPYGPRFRNYDSPYVQRSMKGFGSRR